MPYRLTLKPNGKVRAQRSKDFRMAINGLMTRRYRLISEAPNTLTADLAAIDRSLVLLGFTEDPQPYMPRQCNQRVFVKGEMFRLIRAVLKDVTEPMSSRDLCLTILSDKAAVVIRLTSPSTHVSRWSSSQAACSACGI